MTTQNANNIDLVREPTIAKITLAPSTRFYLIWLPWILAVGTLVIALLMVRLVIWPGYINPQSRMYSSQLGYASYMRQQNLPIPVSTCLPQLRTLTQHFVGEGFVRSTPILVPIVPTSRIDQVLVGEGDRIQAGQLLAKLDHRQATLRLRAAQAMLDVAKAEYERARVGSVYTMDQERPDRDRIRLDSVSDQAQIQEQINDMLQGLYHDGVISRNEMLEQRLSYVQAMAKLREAEVNLHRSEQGRKHSVLIAAAAVREAQLAVEQREAELADYAIVAPADGIIERRLIHEGEYNQDPGKPAFLLASGQWFEAYFDQTVTGHLQSGDDCIISLEAFAGDEIRGKISQIHPFVSFGNSGPEVNRPIRPSGTGAPEWPSTFSVRVELESNELPIYAGLSGLAKIAQTRQALSIPASAVLSASAGKGLVLVRCDDSFETRRVVLGNSVNGWTEIREGLSEADEVLIEGHQVLRPGDLIKVNSSGLSSGLAMSGI